MSSDITSNLCSLVNYERCVNILDERKEEYHGHCDVVRMNKKTPVLWMIQNVVQCENSSLLFVHKVFPLDFPSGGESNYFSKKENIMRWATEGMVKGESGIVCDSWYSTRDVCSWLG